MRTTTAAITTITAIASGMIQEDICMSDEAAVLEPPLSKPEANGVSLSSIRSVLESTPDSLVIVVLPAPSNTL